MLLPLTIDNVCNGRKFFLCGQRSQQHCFGMHLFALQRTAVEAAYCAAARKKIWRKMSVAEATESLLSYLE
jgi:hypothetical protein